MRKALLLAVLITVLGACSNSGRSEAPAAAPPADAEEGGNPDAAAEADADLAMVNRVLAGLDGVMGDLQRILVRERRITTEVTDRLQSIYTGPELLNHIDAFRSDLAHGLAGYKATPGNRVTTVSRLITVSPICVFAEVVRDYSPVAEGTPPPPAGLYVVLVTKHEGDDPRRLNPTPWAMLYDGVQQDGSQPDDVCR